MVRFQKLIIKLKYTTYLAYYANESLFEIKLSFVGFRKIKFLFRYPMLFHLMYLDAQNIILIFIRKFQCNRNAFQKHILKRFCQPLIEITFYVFDSRLATRKSKTSYNYRKNITRNAGLFS